MKRREFTMRLGGSAAWPPWVLHAQQAAMPVVALFRTARADPSLSNAI
jgi:hypothetical protein